MQNMNTVSDMIDPDDYSEESSVSTHSEFADEDFDDGRPTCDERVCYHLLSNFLTLPSNASLQQQQERKYKPRVFATSVFDDNVYPKRSSSSSEEEGREEKQQPQQLQQTDRMWTKELVTAIQGTGSVFIGLRQQRVCCTDGCLETTMTLPYCNACNVQKLCLREAKSTIPNAGNGLFAWSSDPDAIVDETVVFKEGELIYAYQGEILSGEQIEHRYGLDEADELQSGQPSQSNYTYVLPRYHPKRFNYIIGWIDGIQVRGILGLMNDNRTDDGAHCNVEHDAWRCGKFATRANPRGLLDKMDARGSTDDKNFKILCQNANASTMQELQAKGMEPLYATRDICHGQELFLYYGVEYWRSYQRAEAYRKNPRHADTLQMVLDKLASKRKLPKPACEPPPALRKNNNNA